MDIEDFYDQDPRRRASDEIEFGREWSENGQRFEVSWIADTGEVYVMAEPYSRREISTESVTVEVLAVIEAQQLGLGARTGRWGSGFGDLKSPESASRIPMTGQRAARHNGTSALGAARHRTPVLCSVRLLAATSFCAALGRAWQAQIEQYVRSLDLVG
jgi:hypothetical protein